MRKLYFTTILALVWSPLANAYIDYVPLMSVGTWNNNSNVYMEEWRKHIKQTEATSAAGDPATLVPAHASDVPAKLASYYPPEKRAETERTFRDLLAGYHQIEQKFGIPVNDLAGASAAFLAGSWMAYHNVNFPDADYPALVAQMRRIISSNAAFSRASATEKSELYDQLAIRGMFLATAQMALQKQPNPKVAANIRAVAKDNLKEFLGVEADRIKITHEGLALE